MEVFVHIKFGSVQKKGNRVRGESPERVFIQAYVGLN